MSMIAQKIIELRKEWLSATPERRLFIEKQAESLKRAQSWYEKKRDETIRTEKIDAYEEMKELVGS